MCQISVAVHEPDGYDQKGRQREPNVLIQNHELHERAALNERREHVRRHDIAVENPIPSCIGEDRRDDQSGGRESEECGVENAEDRSRVFSMCQFDAAPRDEDDDAHGEDENLRQRYECDVERDADGPEDQFAATNQSDQNVADALGCDDGDVGRDDHLHRLVFSDQEAVAHDDGKEHDDEEIPTQCQR